MKNFKEKLSHTKGFVFDCDGVFTNGDVTMFPGGEAIRTFNVKDGYGVALAVKRGYPICIISGGIGDTMKSRFEALGIKDIYLGCGDKTTALKEFAQKYNLSFEEILFMGDDIPDIEAMTMTGIPTAPKDAAPEVKYVACYVSSLKGGKGCVRDVIEQVLKAQNKWSNSAKDIFSR